MPCGSISQDYELFQGHVDAGWLAESWGRGIARSEKGDNAGEGETWELSGDTENHRTTLESVEQHQNGEQAKVRGSHGGQQQVLALATGSKRREKYSSLGANTSFLMSALPPFRAENISILLLVPSRYGRIYRQLATCRDLSLRSVCGAAEWTLIDHVFFCVF